MRLGDLCHVRLSLYFCYNKVLLKEIASLPRAQVLEAIGSVVPTPRAQHFGGSSEIQDAKSATCLCYIRR